MSKLRSPSPCHNEDSSGAPSTSKCVNSTQSSSEIKDDNFHDLNQQLLELSKPGCDQLLLEPDSLVIHEHKTPKKNTPRKPSSAKKPRSTKKETKNLNTLKFNTEIDDLISENAQKSNLSAVNVKQILKHIVTNEHVLAMVQNTMGAAPADSSNLSVYEPKLTRSKTKELIEKNEKVPWPISPIKPITATEKKIIEAEFKDDESSDEEYEPRKDELESDEESMLSSQVSDFGSPRVPLSPSHFSSPLQIPVPDISEGGSNDSQQCTQTASESDLIASRTRSKLPLTETPLEIIESQFIAPDITTDMYDTECHDEDWKHFLQEFVQPFDTDLLNDTIEEENDPEYNFMDDENKEDEWEMRDDKAVKISKVELSDLMEDLMDCFNDELGENQEAPAAENIQTHVMIIPEPITTTIKIEPATLYKPSPFSENAYNTLAVQLNKHIQLLLQIYLLSCEVSKNDIMESTKMLLLEMKRMSLCQNSSTSIFKSTNLDNAISLIQNTDSQSLIYECNKKKYYEVSLPVKTIICTNPVFFCPEILPRRCFHFVNVLKTKCSFTTAEDGLLAMGIEQFNPAKPHKCMEFIKEYMMPIKTANQLKIRYKNVKSSSILGEENPLKYFMIHDQLKSVDEIAQYKRPQYCKATSVLYLEWLKHRRGKTGRSIFSIAPLPQSPANVTPKKTAIVHPNLVKTSTSPIKASPLKQISPILKKYSRIQKKSPKYSSPNKRILPNITPELLILAACRVKKDVGGVRRKLLPKLNAEDQKTLPVPEPNDIENKKINQKKPEGKQVSKNEEEPVEVLPANECNKKSLDLEENKNEEKNTVSSAVSSVNDSESQSDSEDILEDEGAADKDVDLDALMAASSSICRSKRGKCRTAKKTKQQREIESSLALLGSSTSQLKSNKDEKASVFAQSYLNRVHETLIHDLGRYETFVRLLHDFGKNQDITTVQLFKTIQELFLDHEQLIDEFVGFLLPEEALECGVFTDYLNIARMREFLRKLELHFSKHPQHVQKIVRVFNQFQNQPDFNSADLKTSVIPLLRGQAHLIDEFTSLIPDLQPPESMMTDFEEIDLCDAENDAFREDRSDDEFEVVIIPETQDKYGGKECPCSCHDTAQNPRFQSRIQHCSSCGTKFIDGRVYLQIGKTLKPAKVIYHRLPQQTDVNETSENIQARASNNKESVEHVTKRADKSDSCIKSDQCNDQIASQNFLPVAPKNQARKEVNRTSLVNTLQLDSAKESKTSVIPKRRNAVSLDSLSNKPTPETIIENTMSPLSLKCSRSGFTNFKTVFGSLSNLSENAKYSVTNKEDSNVLRTNCSSEREKKRNNNGEILKICEDAQMCNQAIFMEKSDDSSNLVTSAVDQSSFQTNQNKKRKLSSESKSMKTAKLDQECKDKDCASTKSSCDWSREDDRVLLLNCKESGATGEVFQAVANKLNKTINQVQSRFETLMELLMTDNASQDDSSGDISDNS